MRCNRAMPRHLPVALAVMAALLVPAAAEAKGIATLAVCGPGGCVDRTKVALGSTEYPEQLISGGMPVSDYAVHAEPFVRLRIGVGDGTANSEVFGRYTIALLPRSGFLQLEDGSWAQVQGSALRAFRTVARGVKRWPASRLRLAELPAPTAPPTSTPTVETVRAGAGGTAAWPWAVGGAVLLCAAGALAIRRRRV